ncbi:MAG: amino acid ABC transporter substrate-binding protein, partial [Candidatus Rokuibacteriota bacterium]
MRYGRTVSSLLAVVMAFGLVGIATAQSTIKVPIVVEVTGGGASVGAMWRDAVTMAIEEINRKGGVLGAKLETSVHDTQTDPPTSVAVMRRVLNDKPFAIFG